MAIACDRHPRKVPDQAERGDGWNTHVGWKRALVRSHREPNERTEVGHGPPARVDDHDPRNRSLPRLSHVVRGGGRDPPAWREGALLVLHGGPGLPHDYLSDLAQLADGGRTVVFYDQLGCGRSDHPDDAALWVMDTFVEEVATIRQALGLDRVHLFGHSWGGWLALEYALRRPKGLVVERPPQLCFCYGLASG